MAYTLADIEGRYVLVPPEEGVSLATLGAFIDPRADADAWREENTAPYWHLTLPPDAETSGAFGDARVFATEPSAAAQSQALGAGISFDDFIRTINPDADPSRWGTQYVDARPAESVPDRDDGLPFRSMPSSGISFADLVRTINPTPDPDIWRENESAPFWRLESQNAPSAGIPFADWVRTIDPAAHPLAWDREDRAPAGSQPPSEQDRVPDPNADEPQDPRARWTTSGFGERAVAPDVGGSPRFADDAARWRTDPARPDGAGSARPPVQLAGREIRPIPIVPEMIVRIPDGRGGGGAGRAPPAGPGRLSPGSTGRPNTNVQPKTNSPTPAARPTPAAEPAPALPTPATQPMPVPSAAPPTPTPNPAASNTQITPSPSTTSALPGPRATSATPPPSEPSAAAAQSSSVAPVLRELFAPGGKLIGRRGTSRTVRVIDPDTASQKHSDLNAVGVLVPAPSTYRDGYAVQLPDGSIVGVRDSKQSGLTFDILQTTDRLFHRGLKVHQNDK